MANLSLEALRRGAVAVLRERAAAELALQGVDPESDEAQKLADEVVQMMKVEGEFQDAYNAARAANETSCPTWEELAEAARW